MTEGINRSAVSDWLLANVDGLRSPFEFALIAGGRSNLTYAVTDAAGRRIVLRRPPISHVLPTAHDMAREHRIISALRDTPVPVPAALGYCADEAWERIWAINVQSHVYAARALLPGVLSRGRGYLVITASAAGLLTQLGSAPYAVTKHAAVALAEWLSITYGEQGLVVSCLCPQAVTSNLAATSRRELGEDALPEDLGATGGSAQAAVDGVLGPDQVAATVLAAVAAEQFLILPHPDVATYERRRADDRERWLRGMRRLQARLSERP